MATVIAAIDQGTTSTRCMLFDHDAQVVALEQVEHRQSLPRAGWVEHDAAEIWSNTRRVLAAAVARAELSSGDVAAVGITNQRETAVVWDRATGEPIAPAIVWQDTRTQAICDDLGALGGGAERYRDRVGLPIATYFAGPKVRWLLDNVDGARARAEAGQLAFGTIDSWLVWNLSGGANGGVHVTDVTNASRTMLMDLDTLAWAPDIAAEMGIPLAVLPEIRSSSEVYAHVRERGPLAGVPIAGILGDQQAATFGQACLQPGEAKNTYGTGNFLLLNTGTERVVSEHGLLTTVCYQLGTEAPVYALEGSIAVTGSLVQWLRDNLGLISDAAQVETLAGTVEDNGGAYFVPAFSGLFAPYWRQDARGALVGLTRFVNRGHIARAALEATAFQTREVVDAMNADSGVALTELKVDGGMVGNELLMQFQADILDVPVVRPVIAETTALGAAYAAGLAVGFWSSTDEIRANWTVDKRWEPAMDPARRECLYADWKKAVTKTFDWVEQPDPR
ncbi:MAG: glycerol kinase [Pseudonocardiales bacterium]|jgi:glycerol kinase|nr:glycerol kinase [Pseudonocardiales bacterium]MDT4960962.1 glycerol kinase [Pseudonocardiales bacterium]MDT4973224.1 glycerol kinase [Pseudonocardiales bacterium]MDT4981412.1 glycerol kinase [Pseudonocardiales bacterium]